MGFMMQSEWEENKTILKRGLSWLVESLTVDLVRSTKIYSLKKISWGREEKKFSFIVEKVTYYKAYYFNHI